MRCGGHVLIFDVSSGGRGRFQAGYLTANKVRTSTSFFSHCHLDASAQGLPFLKPLYDHEVAARITAGHFEDATTCKEMVDSFVAPPLLPGDAEIFRRAYPLCGFPPSRHSLRGASSSNNAAEPPERLRRIPRRRPTRSNAVCYLTDTEHIAGRIDEKLIGFISGADTRSSTTVCHNDAEFSHFRGYGHFHLGRRAAMRAAGIKPGDLSPTARPVTMTI